PPHARSLDNFLPRAVLFSVVPPSRISFWGAGCQPVNARTATDFRWLRRKRRAQIYIVSQVAIQKINTMKVTKNIGMLLLAVYLIIYGLLGFGINFGPAIFLLYLVALGAGIFILLGK